MCFILRSVDYYARFFSHVFPFRRRKIIIFLFTLRRRRGVAVARILTIYRIKIHCTSIIIFFLPKFPDINKTTDDVEFRTTTARARVNRHFHELIVFILFRLTTSIMSDN